MDPDRIRGALAGDPQALSELIALATPPVQARVARALLRQPTDRFCAVAELTEDVLVALLSEDGKALLAWRPAAGLSLASLIGLLAQRRVAATLHTRGEPRQAHVLDPRVANDVESSPQTTKASSREILARLLERLQARLSARGMELFERLFVAQQSIEEVCAHMGLTANAVQRWRRSLGRESEAVLREINSPSGITSQRPAAVSGIKLRRGP